jgi:hypothetical protein
MVDTDVPHNDVIDRCSRLCPDEVVPCALEDHVEGAGWCDVEVVPLEAGLQIDVAVEDEFVVLAVNRRDGRVVADLLRY